MAATHYANHDDSRKESTGVSRSTAAAEEHKEREAEDLMELMGFFSPVSKPATRVRPPLFRR